MLTQANLEEGTRLLSNWRMAVADDWGYLKARQYFEDWLLEHGEELLNQATRVKALEATLNLVPVKYLTPGKVHLN